MLHILTPLSSFPFYLIFTHLIPHSGWDPQELVSQEPVWPETTWLSFSANASSVVLKWPCSRVLLILQRWGELLSLDCSNTHLKFVFPEAPGESVGWVSDFSSGHDLTVCGFKPHVRFCADSSEPGACFGFYVSLSLCPSPTGVHSHALSLSPSLSKINKRKCYCVLFTLT